MHREVTRREWLAAAAGASALSACRSISPTAAPNAPAPRVSILRVPAYDQSLYGIMRRIVADHELDVRGRSVVLKPNLVEFEPESSINTHPLLVHAAYEAFRAAGARRVIIAEGPGHRRNTLDLAEAAGYFRTIPAFEDSFVDLNLDDVTRVRRDSRFSRIPKLYLPNTVLGADLLVSIAKMKTHHWVGATLSMKNLFGTVPGGVYGWPKNVLHWSGIEECIVDLDAAYPNKFAIVDGIVGMEGNGPIQGTPKNAGVLVAGRQALAVDATCCRIMKIDPFRIGYLRLAAVVPARLAEQNILQSGESIASAATPFALIPQFQGIRLS